MIDRIYNCMEEVVKRQLEEILEQYDCCKCNQCKKDMCALALNQLPPKYVGSKKGEVYVKFELLEPQLQVNITASITAAIHKVNENKRHN